MSKNTKKLFLSKTDRLITGLCGGLGEFFDTDPTIIRLIWIVVTAVTGVVPGILGYLIASLIVPSKPSK